MKLSIEGRNGRIEVNNKYVFITIGTEEKNTNEEHIVLFEEIEDIVYKKPTKDTYGFLSLYLFTKSFILNKKIKYTLILDKTNEKDLDNNKKIYNFIKGIVSNNNDIKVKEEIIKEETIEEKPNEEPEQIIEDITEKIKEQIINVFFEDEEEKEKEKSQEEVIKPVVKIVKESIVPIETNIIRLSKEPNEKEKQTIEKKEIVIDSPIIKEDTKEEINTIDVNNSETKQEKEEIIKIEKIEQLENKLETLEKELKIITYKELILNKYIDETMDRKKIDKLIIELKKLIEKLEKIKKDINKDEKLLNKYNFLRLKNGNIVIKDINKYLDYSDKNKIEDYIRTYEKTITKYDEIKKETEIISKNTEYKRKEIIISDEDYEKDINVLKGVKTNKEFITKYRKEAQEKVSKIKKEIEKTIDPQVKYKFVRKGISEQTKMLAAINALNVLRPGHSRMSTIALSVLTGTFALHDLLGYDIKKVEYNEVTIKESIVGLDSIDTEKAKNMIALSKNQIDNLIYDCQNKYGDYPKFNEIKNNLLSIKKDIEKEEIELQKIDDKLYDYKMQPRVKILKYKEQ